MICKVKSPHKPQVDKTILQEVNITAAKAQAVAEAEAIAEKQKIAPRRSQWVFPSENPDTPVDLRNFYRHVYLPKVKETGLDGVTWHTLRHTFASRLAMSGATEGTIAALLRHSSTALVRRYTHLSPSHLQEAVEKVARFGRSEPSGEPVKEEPKPVLTGEGESEERGGETAPRTVRFHFNRDRNRDEGIRPMSSRVISCGIFWWR